MFLLAGDPAAKKTPLKTSSVDGPSHTKQEASSKPNNPNAEKDNSFRQFRRLCADIAEESSYLGKTALVRTYITKGSGGGEHFIFTLSLNLNLSCLYQNLC